MRLLNSILLPSLLLTGLVVHCQNFKYGSSAQLQKSASAQQSLIAEQLDHNVAPARGSGRVEREI